MRHGTLTNVIDVYEFFYKFYDVTSEILPIILLAIDVKEDKTSWASERSRRPRLALHLISHWLKEVEPSQRPTYSYI